MNDDMSHGLIMRELRSLQLTQSVPGLNDDTPDDGGPLDVLVGKTRPLFPGCVINCRPIGVLIMEDNKGQDEKIIAVPSPELTQRYAKVFEPTDMPEITLKQIEHFFEHYKDLEPDKWVKVLRWGDADEAKALIVEAIARAKKPATPAGPTRCSLGWRRRWKPNSPIWRPTGRPSCRKASSMPTCFPTTCSSSAGSCPA